MKSIKLKIGMIAASCIVMFAVSCDDYLDVPPTGQLAKSNLVSLAGIDASLIAVYSQVNGRNLRMASPSNWVWGSIRGGDANKGTDPGDFNTINPIQRFETDATNVNPAENWRGLYEGIARANNVMALLAEKGPDVTDADVARIAAQARFLRGHFYFQLKRNFGDTPYVDETVDYDAGIELVKNDRDLWPLIEADFEFAVSNLPDTQTEVGRINVWAAKSYLAKVYLYQEKWTEAKTLFDDVIANGKTSNGKKYDLVPYYDDAFRGANDNHEESIWAYQSAAGTGSVNNANPEFDLNFPYASDGVPGGCCGFFAPSFTFVNSFRTDANGLPLLDGSYNDAANRVKNDMNLESAAAFTPDAGNLDPRLDHTVGRRGLPYLDWSDHKGKAWIRKQDWAGPYSPKKYVYTQEEKSGFLDNSSWTPGYTGINIMVIRFADVLLMAAEAEVELGNLEQARTYVNRVRQRAIDSKLMRENGSAAAKYTIGLYSSPWASADMARNAVRFERKLELGMEGHRFYDLVRWNTVQAEMDAYFALEGTLLQSQMGGASFSDKHKLLPIPQGQIDLIGPDILVQNPGF